MKKTNAVKLALAVGVCAILASVVMLGACGSGAEMTDDDVVDLGKAIRSTETYEGSYTFTDSASVSLSFSEEEDDDTEAFAFVAANSNDAGYDSSSKNYWTESSTKSVNSYYGTNEDEDSATYRVVSGQNAKIYQNDKDRLNENYSSKTYSTVALEDDNTDTSMSSLLPSAIRTRTRTVWDSDNYSYSYEYIPIETLDDFIDVIDYIVDYSTDLSINFDPDYYTCTVSGSSKITYSFDMNYKYSFNENGIKENKNVKLSVAFTVEDDMLVGYKTSLTFTYSLGDIIKIDMSASFNEEVTISYNYTDKIPTDFSDYIDLDADED